MEFKDAVLNRHSVRDFSDQPVSQKDLIEIVNTAKHSPSWANDQVWKVVIATGNSLNQIKQHHLHAGSGQPDFPPLHREAMGEQGRQNVMKWSSDLQTFLGSHATDMANDSAHLFNVPAIAYLLMPSESSLWSAYDLGAFGQTLMLAATDKGIASIPAMEFVAHPKFLHQVLGVSDDYQFAVGIGLGYKKDALINQFRSERMDTDQFLTIKD